MNRDFEINTPDAGSPRSVILPQVTNGIAARMVPTITLIMGGTPAADTRRAP